MYGELVSRIFTSALVRWPTDQRIESGIVCLDEFDKIAKPKSPHGSKDISGEVLPWVPTPNQMQNVLINFTFRACNKPFSK
jgi:hypothetical protein